MRRVRLSDPRLPLGIIRILGHPWTIEVAEVPNLDEPDFISYRYQERETIAVASGLQSASQAWQVWVHLWRTLYGPLVWGVGEAANEAEANAVCRAMWAGLRANAEAVATWFGWVTGAPEVRDGPVCILGQPWQMRLVHRIPGNSVGVWGLERVDDLTLYVRDDLCPHFAAEVALHEMTHAIAKGVSNVGNEEAFVRPMALGLSQVFFDNPEAMMTLLGIEIEPATA